MIIEEPGNDEGPKSVLNSLCSLLITKFNIILNLLGVVQYNGAKIKINTIALIQFKGRLNEEDGSNTENKFVIIFKINYCFCF